MPKVNARARKPAWTLLVYLAGNNNLTQEMAWSLQELKKAADRLNPSTHRPRINVVAHFDPRGSRGRRYDFAPPAVIDGPSPRADEDGNLDQYEAVVYTDAMVRARTQRASRGLPVPADARPSPAHQLAAFLREQVERLHPAREYFLVLSGHGSGAVGDFLIDIDPGTSLSIPELARILADGRKYYAEAHREYEEDGKPKRIGILGMDSCLMSNAEVCFEVRDDAKFLVASEGFASNTGWPYHRVLEAMSGPGSGRAIHVAAQVARNYSRFYRDYEISGLSTDIAVCDLDAFRVKHSRIVEGLRAFSQAWIPRLEAVYAREVVSRTNIQPERARELLKGLARAIAGDVAPRGGLRSLVWMLTQGRAGSLKVLQRVKERKWNRSQLRALYQLLDLLDGHHELDQGSLAARLKKRTSRLWDELRKPSSFETALAATRVFREFDPGVQEALRLIEEREAEGETKAKRARARLQKLHEVRWLLDLHELTVNLDEAALSRRPADDRRLADALVAARVQAQSFKGGVYVDLFDLCRCIEDRLPGYKGPIVEACAAIRRAIVGSRRRPGAVVASHYTGQAFQHAHGLSVFFPSEARAYAPEYENLALARQTGWGRLVRAYLRVTRRGRRDENEHWVHAEDHVLRFGETEIDPLEMDSLDRRIVGVATRPSKDERFGVDEFRGGVEAKSRGGVEAKSRGGVEAKSRGGVEAKSRGESGTAAGWSNPPDGFFRQSADEGSK